MRRWIYASEPVRGDVTALARILRASLPHLLADATGSPVPERQVDGSFAMDLATRALGVESSASVRVTAGVASRSGERTRIPLSWRAQRASAAFPTFDGAVELESLRDDRARLLLVGAYRVPLGALGAAADATLLHGAAHRTVESLTARLAAALEERHHLARLEPEERTAADAAARRPVPEPLEAPLRVREVMSPDPVVFDPELSLRTAALVLASRQLGGAPVVDQTGELLGVLTETDLLEKAAATPRRPHPAGSPDDRRRRARTVGGACSRPAQVTVPEARLGEAARTMLERDVSRLVVVDGSAVVGILSRHDALRALLRSDAALEEAARVVVADADDADLKVQVTWGEVELLGKVERLSSLESIIAEVADLEGAISVDAEQVEVMIDDRVFRTTPPYV